MRRYLTWGYQKCPRGDRVPLYTYVFCGGNIPIYSSDSESIPPNVREDMKFITPYSIKYILAADALDAP